MPRTWSRWTLVVVVVVAGLLLGSRSERAAAASVGTMEPLGEYLAADGTLALPHGAYGSFDATGYRMVSGAGETPRFAPAAPGDEHWAAGFNAPGMGGGVSALAVDGSGRVYAGGGFTSAGTCSSAAGCNSIARWDPSTSSWRALGSGVNSSVNALARGSLWVGGSFTQAGDKASSFIARWDGPLAVTLAAFDATPRSHDILVRWETAVEQDTLGFNVLRATSDDPTRAERLNGALIPAQGSQGGAYAWADPAVTAGTTYFYWLEAVATDGSATRHGPVSATYEASSAVTLGTLRTRAVGGNVGLQGLYGATLLLLSSVGVLLAWRRR